MSKLYLMNTSMMPTPGLVYRPGVVTPKGIHSFYQSCVKKGYNIYSRIGYANTLELLNRLLGTSHQLNREATTDLKPGDRMIVVKLKYRLPDPGAKKESGSQQISDDDFDLWVVSVEED